MVLGPRGVLSLLRASSRIVISASQSASVMPNRAAFSNARAPCVKQGRLLQCALMKSDSRDELTLEFELGIYELGRSLYPRNARVLDGLVTTYAAVGRHQESLQT